MAFCNKCGQELSEGAVVCPSCGAAQQETPAVVDKGGFGWGLLGCCIPIVGLILFLVWKDSKPKSAKAAGIGALVGVVMLVIYYIALFVFGAALGFTGLV